MDKAFDFAAWKAQGEQVLAELEARESQLDEELAETRLEITALKGSLGKPSRTRTKIRPVLRRILVEHGNGPLPYEGLVSEASKETGATEAAVATSLRRWDAADEALTIDTDDNVHLSVP